MGLKYNPVKIHLKRSTTLIGTSTLSKQELNQIYHSFTLAETLSSIRNKVLFGLFIFQGIRSKEIKYINCDCVDMQNACIVIPQGNKTNERILPLDVQQVLLMHRYLTEIRPRILGSRKSELLIVTQKEKNNIKSILNQIYPSLKKLPLKPTLQLIRISVIKNWLAENDLRTVQYMAGHRYISTTENYVTPNLKELKKNIEQCHPMNS
ncbi:site-specific integrase [uncultured Croceitalea sp.]|uniref:tyrosine-type recombinase/integrase n=1 Tax=uncultured Croceitalea sp. TaxID=1798908 RepID=UPI0033066FCB